MSKFIEIEAAEREYGTTYKTVIALDDILWFNEYVVFFRNGVKLYLDEGVYEALSVVLNVASLQIEPKGERANVFKGKLVSCPVCKSSQCVTVINDMGFPEFECLNCGHHYSRWGI